MIKQHALKIGLLFHLVKFAHHMSIWGENAFFFFWKHLLKITAEVLGVEILKFHVSAQGFKMFSAFSAAEIAALGFFCCFPKCAVVRKLSQFYTIFFMFLLKC